MISYNEFINNILETRGRFNCDGEYHERHHILPKCMNGSNDKDNLIDLFAKEHFIAHKLLFEENPDNNDLARAYILMAFAKDKNQDRYELTPEEYEEARKVYARNFSGEKNPSARSVIRLIDDKVYNTLIDCCVDNDIDGSSLWLLLKKHCRFVYYDEWVTMSEGEKNELKTIDWDRIEHENRSRAAKQRNFKGENNPRATPIYCPELDEEFWGAQEAYNKYEVNKNKISMCINGHRKHAGKHPITGEPLSWVKLENKNC